MFCEKRCFWKFSKIHGKHLCWSLFLNKVAGLRPATLIKETPAEVLSCDFCKNFKNTFFTEHIWVTGSGIFLSFFSHTNSLARGTHQKIIHSYLSKPAAEGMKSVRIRSFFGPYFAEFVLERYWLSLRIQSKCRKKQTRRTPNMSTFLAVADLDMHRLMSQNYLEKLYNLLFMIISYYNISVPLRRLRVHKKHSRKKWSLPLKTSSVNLTKSAVSCRFGQIYWWNS